MNDKIERIVIVGGGTAGWISAGILARKLAAYEGKVSITLIESPDIPIIGVGEGTWPTIRNTLQTIGVDETDFIRECDATFKQGAEFVNWQYTPEYDKKHSYFHPLSAVFHSAYDFNLAPYWLAQKERFGAYDFATTTQSKVSQLGLAPKKITTPAYSAIQNYSYHLNASKFADFLKSHCINKLSVNFISANVTQVETTDKQFITKVMTDRAGEVEGDFFIDCSGSKALLIGDALGVGWHSVSDIILNDTALAIQVPYPSPSHPIASHTIATAQECGWTWDIGLSNRRGIGYVYSSNHSTESQAEQVLRQYVGHQSEGLEIRKISLNLGYRKEFFKGNCVAIGMSAAFIEPLEASAIFLIEAAANMVAECFPRYRESLPIVAKKFNDTFKLRWDKSVDFIKLHYCISKRRDTQYWCDNTDSSTVPDSLQEKLTLWCTQVPNKYDFDYAFEPFVLDSYLFVLYGMGYDTKVDLSQLDTQKISLANAKFEEIKMISEKLQTELISHRELIDKVRQFGFQKI